MVSGRGIGRDLRPAPPIIESAVAKRRWRLVLIILAISASYICRLTCALAWAYSHRARIGDEAARRRGNTCGQCTTNHREAASAVTRQATVFGREGCHCSALPGDALLSDARALHLQSPYYLRRAWRMYAWLGETAPHRRPADVEIRLARLKGIAILARLIACLGLLIGQQLKIHNAAADPLSHHGVQAVAKIVRR